MRRTLRSKVRQTRSLRHWHRPPRIYLSPMMGWTNGPLEQQQLLPCWSSNGGATTIRALS
jgi:hypothetical protein